MQFFLLNGYFWHKKFILQSVVCKIRTFRLQTNVAVFFGGGNEGMERGEKILFEKVCLVAVCVVG